MTYEDYWCHSDETLFWAYVEANQLMQKRKRDYDNQMVWLSGLYIRSAIGSCFSKSEYTEPINLDDIERRSEMTSEEILQEDQRHAVSLSQIQIARVMSLLNKERTEGSGDK